MERLQKKRIYRNQYASLWLTALAACGLIFSGSLAAGQEQKYEVVLQGLDNPRGIAIQPETGDVFIAESGALRVVRVVGSDLEEVVTGFSRDYTGKRPIYEIGPLSLLFLDRNTLLVGGGGEDRGKDQVYVIDVPERGADPVAIKNSINKDLRLASDNQHEGNGNFWGLARTEDSVYVTCGDDLRTGWVARTTSKNGRPESLKRFFPTVNTCEVTGPHGLAISPENYLAVSQTGVTTDEQDSLLLFFDQNGEFLDKFETGLNDITGLAYGPNLGRLFAVDFNHASPNDGGLYKLVGTREGCRAIDFSKLSRPSALAFAENGDLYVVTVGKFIEGAKTSNGQLLRFVGLDAPKEETTPNEQPTK